MGGFVVLFTLVYMEFSAEGVRWTLRTAKKIDNPIKDIFILSGGHQLCA